VSVANRSPVHVGLDRCESVAKGRGPCEDLRRETEIGSHRGLQARHLPQLPQRPLRLVRLDDDPAAIPQSQARHRGDARAVEEALLRMAPELATAKFLECTRDPPGITRAVDRKFHMRQFPLGEVGRNRG
jgi:hypothetical protein